MVVHIKKGDTLGEVVEKINHEIDNRRSYGRREEDLPSTNQVSGLYWSNNSRTWLVGMPPTYTWECPEEKIPKKKYAEGEKVNQSHVRGIPMYEIKGCKRKTSRVQNLDANEIVVVGIKREILNSITPFLEVLPLYGGSFESRARGEFSLKGIEMPPGIASALNQGIDELTPDKLKTILGEDFFNE